jgi:hypothetical protein
MCEFEAARGWMMRDEDVLLRLIARRASSRVPRVHRRQCDLSETDHRDFTLKERFRLSA